MDMLILVGKVIRISTEAGTEGEIEVSLAGLTTVVLTAAEELHTFLKGLRVR